MPHPRPHPRTARTAGTLTAAALATALLTGTPAPAVSGDTAPADSYAFTAKLDIGDGRRACTGALVDPFWVVTASSCFADDPAQPTTVPTGPPALRTTVTIGRTDLTTTTGQVRDVVELIPRTDRDLVMLRLVNPVIDVDPLAVSTTAPTPGEELRVTGFGRTKAEWVPDKLHSAAFTVGTVQPTGLGIAAKAPADAAVCKGDTGGPALRKVGDRYELAAVNSRSWQNGCLGSTETTRTGAYETRTDDLGDWIQQTAALDWTTPLVNTNSGKCLEIEDSLLTDGARAQQWTCHGLPTARWTFHWADDAWEVRNANSGKALEIENSLLAEGAPAQQWTFQGLPTQKWDLVKAPGGYALKNRNSGKALEIDDSLKTDGARAQQWTFYDLPTQKWAFSY
ncbi:RICIN domain-containing protein [Kitasatospora sp. NPDC092039]|uniref:RICIN domain-containing protein n=1 Tax=Kitasatospora sp. NPDC092039 TaxID=3364086 RepID=UPI003819A611